MEEEIEIFSQYFDGGEVAAKMVAGYSFVILNQRGSMDIASRTIKAGDICMVAKKELIVVGFSNEGNSYDPKKPLDILKMWAMPKCKLCSLAGYELVPYSRYHLETFGIEIIKEAEEKLNLGNTREKIIEFLTN